MGPQANQQYPHAKQQESRGRRRRRGIIGERGEEKAEEDEMGRRTEKGDMF